MSLKIVVQYVTTRLQGQNYDTIQKEVYVHRVGAGKPFRYGIG